VPYARGKTRTQVLFPASLATAANSGLGCKSLFPVAVTRAESMFQFIQEICDPTCSVMDSIP